jgi:CheY-like chemotaxis protein
VREDFALIRKNIELEARLIDDLLDLTRIARGKLELKRAHCDVHALLRSSLAILQNDFAEHHLRVQTDFRAAAFHVHADAVRLQQVFWNVLRNAVRFTPAAGSLSIRTDSDQPGSICICISDSGVGIQSEELETIFHHFEQGAKGRNAGGLGLGLSISRSLVEHHGGRIHAESAGRGFGATFVIELPLSPAEAAQADVGGTLPAPDGPAASALRILLVEDHEPTRSTLTRLLQRRGHAVITAATLSEARAAARQETIDLLVSDLGLPDGDGCDLMRELTAAGGPPGIAISGFGMDADLERSRAAGFTAHLIKPIDIEALDRELSRASQRQPAVIAAS